MAGVIAIASTTVVRVVVADVHPTLSRSNADVLRDIAEAHVRRHPGAEDELVFTGRPVPKHLDDPPLLDDELDNVPALALDAMIHSRAPIA